MLGYIYKLTNKINGKLYIGMTSYTPKKRFDKHVYEATHRINKGRLHKAIRKHGRENFLIEIVETLEADNKLELKKIMSDREIFYIQNLNTMDQEIGYNCTSGGEGAWGHSVSDETKKRLSDLNTGKKQSKEAIAKTVAANTGSKRSSESKRLMREAASSRMKVVEQYDLGGNFIAEYRCTTEAAEACNGDFRGISACTKGKQKTHRNFIWKYK